LKGGTVGEFFRVLKGNFAGSPLINISFPKIFGGSEGGGAKEATAQHQKHFQDNIFVILIILCLTTIARSIFS
jgi:hypothetical protein